VIQLSRETVLAYDRRLERAAVAESERGAFRKWVRFYLDFCGKYGHPPRERSSIPAFLAKLASKNQPEANQKQALRAVNLLISRPGSAGEARPASAPEGEIVARKTPGTGRPPQARAKKTRGISAEASGPAGATGASWEGEYRELENSIRMRNYSKETLAAYRSWVRKFQGFVRSKPTGDLNGDDVKAFLTDLAVRERVAASTQNQAFNALLY
jgi:hypothetical protein